MVQNLELINIISVLHKTKQEKDFDNIIKCRRKCTDFSYLIDNIIFAIKHCNSVKTLWMFNHAKFQKYIFFSARTVLSLYDFLKNSIKKASSRQQNYIFFCYILNGGMVTFKFLVSYFYLIIICIFLKSTLIIFQKMHKYLSCCILTC